MKKLVWLTSLVQSEETAKNIINQLQGFGLAVNGHFWEDDLKKAAWNNPRAEMLKSDAALWTIIANADDLRSASIRYGLSMLAITITAQKGLSFPILILLNEGEINSAELPTPLKSAEIHSLADPATGAKVLAKVHSAAPSVASEYRLDVYGNPQLGQWFEVGPKKGEWQGGMLGVVGGKVLFQAVGPKESLPEKSVLNFPVQDLKLQIGDKECLACAVQNPIDESTSYFVKVEGQPEKILFGSYSQDDEAEVFVVDLQ